MFANLDLFQIAGRMANHASVRQRVVAENIANVDTPGYRQRDVVPFAETVPDTRNSMALRTNDPRHFIGGGQTAEGVPTPHEVRDALTGPNRNSVSLEGEMVKTAQIRHQHETALAVYRSSLTILRATLRHR